MTDTDPGTDTVRALRTVWWLMLLRGVLAVVFGLYALISPVSALVTVVYVYGFYALFDGITALVAGVRHRRAGHWAWQLVQGVVSLVAGLVALFWPGPTVLALVLIVAVWSIVRGVAEIVEAFAGRRQGASWVWPALGGVAAILFGIGLIASPAAGALVLLWIIGLTVLVLGGVYVVWALRLRAAAKAVTGAR